MCSDDAHATLLSLVSLVYIFKWSVKQNVKWSRRRFLCSATRDGEWGGERSKKRGERWASEHLQECFISVPASYCTYNKSFRFAPPFGRQTSCLHGNSLFLLFNKTGIFCQPLHLLCSSRPWEARRERRKNFIRVHYQSARRGTRECIQEQIEYWKALELAATRELERFLFSIFQHLGFLGLWKQNSFSHCLHEKFHSTARYSLTASSFIVRRERGEANNWWTGRGSDVNTKNCWRWTKRRLKLWAWRVEFFAICRIKFRFPYHPITSSPHCWPHPNATERIFSQNEEKCDLKNI